MNKKSRDMMRLQSALLLAFAASLIASAQPYAVSTLAGAAQGSAYTTYIGDAFPYQVRAMVTDAAGNTYITGARTITASPVAGGPPLSTDVFVTKLDGTGNLLFTATLSGKGIDVGNGIAVDSAGNIWVAGSTTSTDFPLRNSLQATSAANGGTGTSGFLTKLSADGGILFSTVLGGAQAPGAMNAVAVDSEGNAYVVGYTAASDYEHTAGMPAGSVLDSGVGYQSAAFFAKISASGDRFIYAGGVSVTLPCNAIMCGFAQTIAAAIAVDPAGNCYVAGNGGGTGLPVTPGAFQSAGAGAFVMKISAAGTGLVYLTMLDATAESTVTAIAADAAGNAYITGSTTDANFPTTSDALQPTYNSASQDAFVAKLNASGTAMVWASYLGGSGTAAGQAIAVDASENVWVSGVAGLVAGAEFLLELNAAGSALLQAEGFPADTVAAVMELDGSGVVHTAGATGIVSAMTPSLAHGPRLLAIGNAAGGVLGGRFAPGELISLYGQFPGVTAATASFNAAGFLPNDLAGVQVTIGGIAAPLLYVSGTQINAVVPGALTPSSVAQVQVTAGGVQLPGFRVVVDTADPQVFRNADGSAIAINQDGSLNSAANPAPQQSVVTIWATGTGFVYGSTDGQEQSTAQSSCSCSIDEPLALNSIFPAYAGAAPGTVNGVTQVNFEIPSPPDTVNNEIFRLFAAGQWSDQTFVFVH